MGPPPTLRVMTYNVHDLHDDQAAAARVVRAIAPDVLCLQEVPRQLFGAWRTSSFAAACQLTWAGNHRGSGGSTIFTSLRVDARTVRHVALPTRRGQRTRGYAVATVGWAGGTTQVVSMHLGLDERERTRHTDEIAHDVDLRDGRAGSLVLAGDLNETDEGSSWQAIVQHLAVVSGPASTFPVATPTSRIDAIFASDDLVTVTTSTLDPGVDAETERAIASGSDHRPVWVDLARRGVHG